MARQFDKGYYLKRLFEKQLVRTDPEATPDQREAQAVDIMDNLLGPRWRKEVNAGGVELVQVKEVPCAQDVAEFWDRVQQLGYEEGFGTESVEHDVPADKPECQCHPRPLEGTVTIARGLLGVRRR